MYIHIHLSCALFLTPTMLISIYSPPTECCARHEDSAAVLSTGLIFGQILRYRRLHILQKCTYYIPWRIVVALEVAPRIGTELYGAAKSFCVLPHYLHASSQWAKFQAFIV